MKRFTIRSCAANEWLLELFHGPTLAFKDVATRILARLMEYMLQEKNETLTIVGGTSGDTGGAALAVFSGRDNIDILFMFPENRISPVQQRQMTKVRGENTYAIAIDGSLMIATTWSKPCSRTTRFATKVRLSAVNSINWGRIIAQTVYYFTAAASLRAPDHAVSFTVPTGISGTSMQGMWPGKWVCQLSVLSLQRMRMIF